MKVFAIFLLLVCSGTAFAQQDERDLLAENYGGAMPHVFRLVSSSIPDYTVMLVKEGYWTRAHGRVNKKMYNELDRLVFYAEASKCRDIRWGCTTGPGAHPPNCASRAYSSCQAGHFAAVKLQGDPYGAQRMLTQARLDYARR